MFKPPFAQTGITIVGHLCNNNLCQQCS